MIAYSGNNSNLTKVILVLFFKIENAECKAIAYMYKKTLHYLQVLCFKRF